MKYMQAGNHANYNTVGKSKRIHKRLRNRALRRVPVNEVPVCNRYAGWVD